METLQAFHAVAPVRKPGKLVSVALVGSLHVAAIYILLVALDIVPNPVKPAPPISIRVLTQTKIKVPSPPSVLGVAMAHPNAPHPLPPPIYIDTVPSGATAIAPNTNTNPVAPTPMPTGISRSARPIDATHTIPPYPPLAVRLGYEGTVRLDIAVDEHGNVVSADVLGSSGHADLDKAAVNWVKAHWRYQPAIQNGNVVPARTNAVVTFKLNQLRG